jgi:hypothetical protein
MNFEEWLSYGIKQKFCTDIVCGTHDGVPYTPEEEAEWDEGNDPCAPLLRIWGDASE